MESDDNTSLRVASFSYYLDTAKESLVQRVSAQETPIPLITSEKTNSSSSKPPFSIKFSKSKDSLTNLDNFVLEVSGPVQDPTSAFTFSHEIAKDGEIGVFGADRYFNMKLGYQNDQVLAPKHDLPRLDQSNIKPKSPSLSSDASSWNSQTTLLRSESQSKQKKGSERECSQFGCKGPCFDKKSVHIDEFVTQGAHYGSKPSRASSERIDPLALVSSPDLRINKVEEFVESRPSIEVFGSGTSSMKGGDNNIIAANMERKLSVLTWDAIPNGLNKLPNSAHGSSTICDDMASDASSDLFEIENVAGSTLPFTTCEPADDDTSSISHYAPSEASIQWSVVTASAAADHSVLSDYDDETSVSVAGDLISRKNVISKTRIQGGKEVQIGRSARLLGCKSHKAVDVAENAWCRTNEKTKNQGLDLSASHGKSQASTGRVIYIDTLKLPRSFTNSGHI